MSQSTESILDYEYLEKCSFSGSTVQVLEDVKSKDFIYPTTASGRVSAKLCNALKYLLEHENGIYEIKLNDKTIIKDPNDTVSEGLLFMTKNDKGEIGFKTADDKYYFIFLANVQNYNRDHKLEKRIYDQNGNFMTKEQYESIVFTQSLKQMKL